MKINGFVALILALAAPSLAQATTPTLQFQSGADTLGIPLVAESDGTFGIAPGTYTWGSTTFTFNNLTLNPDPSVSYGFGVTNNSSSTASFSFTFPTTPLSVSLPAGNYTVTSSLAGSLTDGGSDGVTFAPTTGAIQKAYVDSTDAGVDLGLTPITVASSPFSQPFGPLTATSTLTLGSPGSTMDVVTAFSLTAGDSVSFSGRFDIEPAAVPEPSSLYFALIAAGAFGVLIVRTRRVRA